MSDRPAENCAPQAFVIGWPVAHSRSPLIHGYWLAELGLDGSYERIALEPDHAVDFLKALPGSRFAGGNVTIPHKEIACSLVAHRDAVAEALGAVNTLWIESGKLCGTNTDAYGFMTNLDETVPGWDKSARHAVVLGAGGAARAVIWSLAARGISVSIVNRNVARANELADRFPGSRAHGWEELPRLLASAEVLVNTTPLGMSVKSAMEIDLTPMSTDALVADIVYVPLETPLLAQARARGNRTVDGLGMLLHQAVPGFERWFGRTPRVTAGLRQHIIADLEGVHA